MKEIVNWSDEADAYELRRETKDQRAFEAV
jgi:hypothetical protein